MVYLQTRSGTMASTRKEKYQNLRESIQETEENVSVQENKVDLEKLNLDFLDSHKEEAKATEELEEANEKVFSTMEMKKVSVDSEASKILQEVNKKASYPKETTALKRTESIPLEERERNQKRFVNESTRQISSKDVLDRSVEIDKSKNRIKKDKRDDYEQNYGAIIKIILVIFFLAIAAIVLLILAVTR